MKRKSFLFGIFVLLIVLTNSCEIGLGSSVDTETPTFSFTWPKVDEGESPVVRDLFNIRGLWSDDGEIDKVEITFTKTDNSFTKKYTYKGTDKDTITLIKDAETGIGYWNCLVDYSKDNIPDGTYAVRVLFVDKYSHKSENSCQITIDNTPPIVVLQRPSAPDTNGTPDSYGQSFTLVGQAADDNNVSLIEVKIYNEETKTSEPYLVSLKNVPNSINMDVAKFVDGDATTDYAKIYGHATKSGEEIRYCDIVAYDSAQKYPLKDDEVQSEDDKKGNKRDYYYLYEDIATSILSQFKITEVYSMYNGTYKGTGNRSAADVTKDIEDVHKILEDDKYKIKLGTFSLNPANNPTFTVAGRQQISGQADFFTMEENRVSNNSEVVIEVGVGLDSYPLKETTLKPYAIECDENGVAKNDTKIYFSETTRQKSGTSYKFVTKVTTRDKLIIGKNYIFGVEGKDEKENDVMPAGKGYGFRLSSSGAAPIVNITNPPLSVTYLKKGEKLDITGTVSVEDGTPEVKIALPNGSTKDITVVKQNSTDPNSRLFSFTYTIPVGGADGFAQNSSTEYEYAITASQEGPEALVKKTIMYDVDGPKIEILSCDPIAEKYDDNNAQVPGSYLNGTVSARISVSDDFDTVNKDSIKWEIIQNGNVISGMGGKITKTPTDNITIDTTQIPDGTITLKITAKDRAGNESIETKDYIVDQETDNPRLIPNDENFDFSIDTKAKMNVPENRKNKIPMGNQLILKYYDDDGVKNIEFQKANLGGNDVDSVNWETISNDDIEKFDISGKSGNITYNLPALSGMYAFKAKITDINENGAQKVKEFGPFIIKMTSKAPNINTVTTNKEYSNTANSTSIINTVEFSASEYPVYLDYSTDGGTTWTEDADSTSDDNDILLQHQLSSIANTTTFTYRVRTHDGAISNTKTFTSKIDNTNPTISIEKLDNKTKQNALSETPYRFEGKVSDDASGIAKAYYIIQSKTAAEPALPTSENIGSWQELDLGSSSWYKEIAITEGLNQRIYVCAQDEAGNVCNSVSKDFDVDKSVPSLEVAALSKTITNEAITLSGTATDTNGKPTVTITSGTKTWTPTVADGTGAWTQTINLGNAESQLSDGIHTITITAKDIATKTSATNYTVTVDTTKPQLSFDNDTAAKFTNKTQVTYSGTITDTNFDKATLKLIKMSDNSTVTTTEVKALDVSGNWSETFYDLENAESYKLEVTVTDKANNETKKTTTFSTTIDTTSPTTTFVRIGTNKIFNENGGEISENANVTGNSNFANDSYTIGGTITETNFSSATLKVNDTLKNFTSGGTNAGAWTYNQSGTTGGVFKYEITIVDKAGNQITETRTITIDKTSPNLTITAPISGKTGTNALTDNTYNFKGNADDGESGTGVVKLYYAFTNSATAPANMADYTVENISDGNWSFSKDIDNGTTPAENQLSEGNWYLHVKAQDKAGNITTVQTRAFDLDKNAPEIVTKFADNTNITDSTTKVKLEKFGLKVTVTDTHKLDATTPLTLTVKKDGEVYASSNYDFTKVTATPTTSCDYTFEFKNTVTVADGSYSFEFTGKDTVGKTTVITRNITLDTKGPALTVITPDLSAWQLSKAFNIQGSASDLSGVHAVYYSFNPATAPTAPTGTVNPSSWAPTGFTKLTGTTSWTIELTSVPEKDTNKLYIWAVDSNGIVSTNTQTIKVDATNPTLTETGIGTTGATIASGGSFTLSGEVSDGQSGLKSLIITDSLNEANSWTVTLPASGNTWSQAIALGNENNKLKDGEHVLTLTATDNAGRTTTQSRNVKIDTKAPTAGSTSITTTAGGIKGSVNWYKNQQISIKVEGVSDGDNHGYNSGISSVEYSLDNSLWTSLVRDNSVTTKWTGTPYCDKQGSNTIYIRVKDTVGNITNATPLTALIDTLQPVEPSEYSVGGENDFTGAKLVNGRNDVTVTLKVADDTTGGDGTSAGIKSVTYAGKTSTVNGVFASDTWTVTIPKTQISTSQAKFTITDYAGNSEEWKPFSFNLDNTAPQVKINPIADADLSATNTQVNGTITVSGTASDTQGLSSIDLVAYGTKASEASAKWHYLQNFTASGISFPWTYDVDTTQFKDETSLTFAVIVTDSAGNRNFDTNGASGITDNTTLSSGNRIPSQTPENIASANKAAVTVSQDTDRPIITLTNLSLSSYDSSTSIGFENKDLYGNVTDDDGTVTKLYYYQGDTLPNSPTWNEISLSNGTWKLSNEDGAKKLWFKVTDANSKDFITSTTYSLTGIKLRGNEDNATIYGSKGTYKSPLLNIKIDTKDPDVLKVQFIKEKDYADSKWSDSFGSATFGGVESKFKIRVFAYDLNGISSVKLNITSKEGDSAGFTYEYTLTEGTYTETKNNITYKEYVSNEINVNDVINYKKLVTGAHEADITTIDGGNRRKLNSISFAVDNTPNENSFVTPKENEWLYGDIQAQGNAESNPKYYFAVSTSGTVHPESGNAVTQWTDYKDDTSGDVNNIGADIQSKIKYTEITNAGINWFVYFDGDTTANDDKHHAPNLSEYLKDFGITTEENIKNNSFDSVVGLYLWIKTVDEVGNVSENCRLMQYDPQGDRPKVEYSYPKNDATLGGKIRVTGSTSIPIGYVEKVYVQIAERRGEGEIKDDTFTQADLDLISGKGYTIKNMKTGDTYTSGNVATPSDYGIEAKVVGSSWSLEINNNKEFDVAKDVKKLALHAYAISNTSKSSRKTTINVEFDANSPIIGQKQPLYLVQSTDSGLVANGNNIPDFKATAWREYESNMFVKGKWYLIGSVEDNDGIEVLKINNQDVANVVNADIKEGYKSQTKYFKYELNTNSGVGELEITIQAEDYAHKISNQTILISYDNQSPVLIGADNASYDISPSVVQDNGKYVLTSQATEDTVSGKSQSGVKYVAFYFVRRNKVGTEVDSIYNPLLKVNDSSNKTNITSAVADSAAATGTVYKSGLYWKKQTVTRSETLNELTNVTADKNCVRNGGLVEIGGSLYTINNVSGSTVTINGNPPKSATTAYFAYAQLVDNKTQETGSYDSVDGNGYPTSISNTDGDGMVEYLNAKSVTASWSAEINSKNIPDGPIEVHYTVFDAAGNYSIGIVGNESHADFVNAGKGTQTPDKVDYRSMYNNANRTSNVLYVDGSANQSLSNNASANIYNATYRIPAFVKNNAPRLAGVTVWTDYDGDNTKDKGESETRYYQSGMVVVNNGAETRPLKVTEKLIVSGASESSPKDYNENGIAFMTIRDKTSFTPEIIGGNGQLFYKQRIGSAANFTSGTGFPGASTINKGNSVALKDSSNNNVNGNPDNQDYFTDGYVNITDAHKKGEIVFGGTKNANGSIQDFADLGANSTSNDPTWFEYTIWDSTEGTTVGVDSLSAVMRLALAVDYFDSVKPKVEIKPFYWTKAGVPDDSTAPRYNSIAWDENGEPLGHIELSNDLPAATFNAATGVYDKDPKVSGKIIIEGTAFDNIRLKSIYATFAGITSISQANTTINYSEWKTTGSAYKENVANGWKFSVQEVSAIAEGHTVNWTLEVDTSKITNTADVDKAVTVVAIDERGNNFAGVSSSGNEENTNVPYQMDVVPYITKVTRNGGYLTHRSKFGNIPVMRGETGNTVSGFNIPTTANVSLRTRNAGGVATTVASGNASSFTIPNTAINGEVSVTVNNIKNLNNVNDNSKAYNKETDSQFKWGDDRVLSVFKTDGNDIFPDSANLQYPAMSMGTTGNLFASFTNSSMSDVWASQLNTTGHTRIFHAGDQPEETDIFIYGEGTMNVIYQANHLFGGEQARWSARAEGSGSINLYHPDAPKSDSYTNGGGGYWRFECFYHNQVLRQMKNARSTTANGSTIHTIWYDSITNAIKYSNVTNNNDTKGYQLRENNNTDGARNNYDSQMQEIAWVVLDGEADLDDIVGSNQTHTENYNGGAAYYPNRTFNHKYMDGSTKGSAYSVALGLTEAEKTAIMNLDENSLRKQRAIDANPDYNSYNYTDHYEEISPSNACGETAAICVTSNGLPVVVYFDSQYNTLRLARTNQTNPKGIGDNGAGSWRIQQVPLTGNHLGNNADYITARIDAQNYLHIAFENSRGQLIYVKSSNNPTNGTKYTFNNSVIVDEDCGMWADLTVDSNNKPYISYMSKTNSYDSIKIAYCEETDTTNSDNWETIFAPMTAKAGNVRTCIEARPTNQTGGQTNDETTSGSFWKVAVGFCPGKDYRVVKYIGDGSRTY